ncbi:hypothetical protein SAMN04487970_10028 [Paenibacillus tianmuensis]|uniref:Uncharacterized protein n=1 Tax=Paenibacillus tianmuensis TaxID=624147 RepID=A0A1G4PCB9_9BACL|nr:hypothetical protein [Paenibacillus tianmuensis]SCW29957.1 hypothetical protein SAMN04487970_10028 [Paenibacillus tianmuensis]
MEYYLLTQDTRIADYARPVGGPQFFSPKSASYQERFYALKDESLQFYTRGSDEYLDYIERPYPLVSERLKEALERCQKDILYKLVILTDLQQSKQTVYWFLAPETVSCLSSETEWHKNGAINKLVLDSSKIGSYKVFQIAGTIEPYLVVDVDTAESALSLNPQGIQLTRLEFIR